MKNIKTQKGITLIALVITIIVMLILVGVTISMALNGGLFGYAKTAAKDTESQKQAEQELASGKVTVNGKEYDSINAYLESMEGVLKENTPYVSDGRTAIIPKGFKIIADENGKKSIDAGLVIQDEAGNEYVWVPVEDGTLDRTDWSDNKPTEMLPGDSQNKYLESLPQALKDSIIANKGFYIGRYEAGSKEPRTEAGKDALTEVLTQKGLYPYNYVSYDNAVGQIAKMYTDKTKYGVEAVLTYGAMWDETMRFIRDTNNVTDSTTWGNYKNAKFTSTGKYCESPSATTPTYTEGSDIDKPENTAWLLTTGASETNKAKNIYDLAGNIAEWTEEVMEYTDLTHSWGEIDTTIYQIYRGGDYDDRGCPASYRGYSISPSYNSIGFRSALYIK